MPLNHLQLLSTRDNFARRRRPFARIVLTLGALVLTAPQVNAQVRAGDRVRIRLISNPDGRSFITGEVAASTGDSLRLTIENPALTTRQTMSVPASRIATIERRAGRERSTWRVAQRAGIVGLFAGSLVGAFVFQRPRECVPVEVRPAVFEQECIEPISGTKGAFWGAGLGIGAGVLIGAFIGSRMMHDIWEPVFGNAVSLGFSGTNGIEVRWSW